MLSPSLTAGGKDPERVQSGPSFTASRQLLPVKSCDHLKAKLFDIGGRAWTFAQGAICFQIALNRWDCCRTCPISSKRVMACFEGLPNLKARTFPLRDSKRLKCYLTKISGFRNCIFSCYAADIIAKKLCFTFYPQLLHFQNVNKA